MTFGRIAPRPFDDDGLAISFKAIRDEVAKQLGHDDNPDSKIKWAYSQRRGEVKEHSVVITVTPNPKSCAECGRTLETL